jgi:hypothetical protein
MDNWQIEYDLIDKEVNPKGRLRTAVTFKGNQWSRIERYRRRVVMLSLSRTLPASESHTFSYRNKLSIHGNLKSGKTTFSSREIEQLPEIKQHSERILGKSLENFKLLEVTFTTRRGSGTPVTFKWENELLETNADGSEVFVRRKVERAVKSQRPSVIIGNQLIYVGSSERGETYSEFNFGTGEASIIRIVATIENLEDSSLVLIEEIENGLHPLALSRLVEYLIDVATRKRIQTVFTSHSDYALIPLPSEAIWACVDWRTQQGKLSVESLRAISGRVDRKLAVFVEDEFAKSWVEAMAREFLGARFEEIGFYAVGGDGNAVKIHSSHNANPSIGFRSICLLDGDSSQEENRNGGVYRLPGKRPETTVFDAVINNIDANIAQLTVACQRPIDKQTEVMNVIKEISHTNRDPHLLFVQVGQRLAFMPEATIRGAFFAVWIQENTRIAEELCHLIGAALDHPRRL